MPSTVIHRFTYDERAQTLDIEFVGGRRYRYLGVPPSMASAFAGAFAKGRFFNSRIRDDFACRELTEKASEDLWDL